MGKGRKKRSSKSAVTPAPPLGGGQEGFKVGSEDSHGFLQQEQVKPDAPIAEKTNSVNVEAAPFADVKNKASLNGESSSFLRPKNSSSAPCRFFQRGYCRYGNFCRFEHLASASASTEPLYSAPIVRAKVPSEKSRAPEECQDWHLTGSCPRYRTCRYAHPINHDVEGSRSGMPMDSGMGFGGFEYMTAQLLRHGSIGGRGGRDDVKMEQRMRNGGFTDDDVYELSLQGIKPWDPEAWDALAVLNGWDMDGRFDYDDYDDESFGF